MSELLHIYAFGSLCRGEIFPGSDIDLLAVATGKKAKGRVTPSKFSIYSHKKIQRIWMEGNPFAWHLYLESRLIYSQNGKDFLMECGKPSTYTEAKSDCSRFISIFEDAMKSAREDRASIVFDLSSAFLGLRNFSSCYLLGQGKPDFTRNVALNLMDGNSPINGEVYRILERARLLCTRGYGNNLTKSDISASIEALPYIQEWMYNVLHGGRHD